MKKKVLAVLLTVAMVATMLAGCGENEEKGDAAENKETETEDGEKDAEEQAASGEKIVFWHWWTGNEEKKLIELVDRYMEETGVEVELQKCVDMASVMTAIAGGTPPDLLMLGGASSMHELYQQGALQSMESYMEADGISKDIFIDSAVQCLTAVDGQMYALPHMGFNSALLWNKELFEEAGLDPDSPPQTAEEMLEYAKQLTKVDESGNIIQLGFSPQKSGVGIDGAGVNHMMFGGSFYDEESGQYTLDDEGMVEYFEWLQSFNEDLDRQAVRDFVASYPGWLTADDLFLAGKTAMHIEGCYAVMFIKATDPEFNYGISALPVSENNPEMEGLNGISYNPYCIPVGAANEQGAWDLMKYITLDKERVAEFADVSANVSHLKDTDTEYTSEFLESEEFSAFVAMTKEDTCFTNPAHPKVTDFGVKISEVFEEMLSNSDADMRSLLEEANNALNQ